MKDCEVWKLVKPLIRKRFKVPEWGCVETYKKYYEAAATVGHIRDARHEREFYNVRNYIEAKQFKNKCMWQQGNKQSLTYRSNRMEENLSYILRKYRSQRLCKYLWDVRNRSWDTIGHVVALDESGAEQIAKMMYVAQLAGGRVGVQGGKVPIWEGDQTPFISSMNEMIQENQGMIGRHNRNIKDIEEKIEHCQNEIEFLTLNMLAFSDEGD